MMRGVEPFFRGLPEAVLMAERLHELADGAPALERMAPDLAGTAAAIRKMAQSFEP